MVWPWFSWCGAWTMVNEPMIFIKNQRFRSEINETSSAPRATDRTRTASLEQPKPVRLRAFEINENLDQILDHGLHGFAWFALIFHRKH